MIDTIADLDVGTVGEAMIAHGAATSLPSAVEVEPMGVGVGLLGSLARVRLTWPPGVEGPASVVAKLPTTSPDNRVIVDRFGYDRREAGVYRELRPWERAPAPRALAQGWDDGTGRGWLLLEDLGHLRAGDHLAGASDEEAVAAVEALARWHAAWWDDPDLADRSWLPASTDPVIAGYGEIFDLTWAMCVDRLGGVGDDTAAAARAGRRWFDVAIEEFATGPRTLVHGDARLDNVLFGPGGDREGGGGDGGHPDAMLLDFQLAARGRGVYDVAFFCAGSLATTDRRRLEPTLLRRYREALASLGVDVDEPTLWRDYRLGLMLNLPNPVSALAVVDPGDERGAAVLRHNALRGLAAVADHVAVLG